MHVGLLSLTGLHFPFLLFTVLHLFSSLILCSSQVNSVLHCCVLFFTDVYCSSLLHTDLQYSSLFLRTLHYPIWPPFPLSRHSPISLSADHWIRVIWLSYFLSETQEHNCHYLSIYIFLSDAYVWNGNLYANPNLSDTGYWVYILKHKASRGKMLSYRNIVSNCFTRHEHFQLHHELVGLWLKFTN